MDRTQRVRERSESGATVSFGHLLREWRTRCHLSQLDLATGAGVSSRHLSFIETGRAQPSRELALLLAAVLDLPLRERNALLATAASLIQWLHRDLVSGLGDAETRGLMDDLLSYPDVPRQWRTVDLEASPLPFLSIEIRKGNLALSDFTTLTRLGTPHDITLQELRIESFFPADEATEEFSRA